MSLLLHTCCAPCAIYPLKLLRDEGRQVTAYFFNPNIHPYTEFRRRRETLATYAAANGLPLLVEEEYGLEEFLRLVAFDPAGRCPVCYRLRLERTAAKARELGMAGFTTTLLVSPYQDHALLRETGETVAAAAGIPFVYRDFRPGFREAQGQAREMGLYRQPYCGCIYSEKDRYYRVKRRAKLD
ncbi:MAG: epoxyqueuosine reductase QueH [Heliobacteriaceae bacterium]|nr:epoxyqueuosine reductase QueH [Heliobacteriaceae bacterium]MDD4587103.1 epoxyqueuosine reductase QueH [Heliobacteriaceae bacterium]